MMNKYYSTFSIHIFHKLICLYLNLDINLYQMSLVLNYNDLSPDSMTLY